MNNLTNDNTLRIGVLSLADMKARTIAIARGELKLSADEPKLWFTSIDSLAKLLSNKNRILLDLIIGNNPKSISELEIFSGRAKSNLSRTLKTMERYGLVKLHKEVGGTIQPRVPYDNINLDLQIAKRSNQP